SAKAEALQTNEKGGKRKKKENPKPTLVIYASKGSSEPFSEEEIKKSFVPNGKNKAARPDNILSEFYQSCWDIIRKDIIKGEVGIILKLDTEKAYDKGFLITIWANISEAIRGLCDHIIPSSVAILLMLYLYELIEIFVINGKEDTAVNYLIGLYGRKILKKGCLHGRVEEILLARGACLEKIEVAFKYEDCWVNNQPLFFFLKKTCQRGFGKKKEQEIKRKRVK
ncbi:hypothetical protein ACJX0J_006533, partial [Zea mays]